MSLPERFMRQFDVLEKIKHISCVGVLIEERDESLTHRVKVRHVPEKHQDIVRFCQRRNPISHPVAMFRKTHALSVGGYPDGYPEDYFLWLKMIQSGYKFANIQEVLLNMRTGNNKNSIVVTPGRWFADGTNMAGLIPAAWDKSKSDLEVQHRFECL